MYYGGDVFVDCRTTGVVAWYIGVKTTQNSKFGNYHSRCLDRKTFRIRGVNASTHQVLSLLRGIRLGGNAVH
jgi:hypothetical protein